MNTFTYNLSETEFLVFHTTQSNFELYSGHDGSTDRTKIATYQTGKWKFDDFQQKKLFWFLFGIYKQEFGKALKAYMRSLREKPSMYEFSCVTRRINIKVTRMKRGWENWFYGFFWQNRK